jgi:ribosomal-protein-alanine N-acetyltransferase
MKKPYKNMPIISFDHYMLRTIKKSDYKDMYIYGKDDETTKYLSWGPFLDPLEAKYSITKIFYPRVKQGLPIGYAIIDTNKNQMIGTVDFHTKPMNRNYAEIGYVIHKDYWGQGIMTKAVNALVKIGFEHLNYDKIIVKHISKNIGSKKVILKSGFNYVKKEPYILEKRSYVLSDELLTYEMTKEQYNERKQS